MQGNRKNWGNVTSVQEWVIKIAIMLYIFVVLAFSYIDGLTIILKVATFSLFLVFLYIVFLKKRLPTFPWPLYIIVAWIFYSASAVFIAKDLDLYSFRLVTMFSVIGATLIIYYMLFFVKSIFIFWNAYYVSCFFVGIFSLMNKGALSSIDGRLFGTFGNSNLFGLVMVVAFLYGLYLFVSVGVLKKIVIVLFQALFFYLVLESGSRKSLVSVVLCSGIFFSAYLYETIKVSFAKALMAIAISLCVAFVGFMSIKESSHYERMERLVLATFTDKETLSSADSSLSSRKKMVDKGIEVAFNNPIFGIGLNNFAHVEADSFWRTSFNTYAHNNYVEVAATTGLVGVIIFYSFHVSVFVVLLRSLRGKDHETKIFLLFNITILFNCMLNDIATVSYYNKVFWLLMVFIIAIIIRPSMLVKSKNRHGAKVAVARKALY